jgi:hypothetical protein
MNPLVPLAMNPLSLVFDWPTQSQQGARRNAMIATTALAARRAERDDVEDFLAALEPSQPAHQAPVAARR